MVNKPSRLHPIVPRYKGCPKCGGRLALVSGFDTCRDCGHRLGSERSDWEYKSGRVEPKFDSGDR